MKKLILTAAISLVAVGVWAQGQVVPNTSGNGAFLRWTNSTGKIYAGTDGLKVQLYYGATALTVINPDPTGTMTLGSGAGQYVLNSTGGSTHTVAGVAEGATVSWQLRAWTGGYASYDAAVASGLSSVYVSALAGPGSAPVISATAGAPNGSPPTTPTVLLWTPGSTSTAPGMALMVPVPEPSTIVLCALGLVGLVAIRRRK